MKTIGVRDFRTKPKEVRESLKSETIVTSNGKPFALLLPVTVENLDETLRLVRRVRAQQALDTIHRQSVVSGKERLTLKAIDAVIKDVRRKRRRRTGAK